MDPQARQAGVLDQKPILLREATDSEMHRAIANGEEISVLIPELSSEFWSDDGLRREDVQVADHSGCCLLQKPADPNKKVR